MPNPRLHSCFTVIVFLAILALQACASTNPPDAKGLTKIGSMKGQLILPGNFLWIMDPFGKTVMVPHRPESSAIENYLKVKRTQEEKTGPWWKSKIVKMKLLSYIKRSIFSENVAGKVVLITGASSGIGEDLAYEYAVRGARLALVARREDRLRAVADKARNLGSPDVFQVRADISKVEDCKRIIDETLNHFGQLDHLVNNAGISQAEYFEDCTEVSDLTHIMDVNFWGSIFCSRFAIPHLRRSKGKIVVISSVAPWSLTPKLSVYNASKAALISFYGTLRVEIGSHIGITIVMPGLIDTEMTSPSSLAKFSVKFFPPYEPANQCAKAIVKSTCRGDRHLTEPFWWNALLMVKSLCPEALDLLLCWNFMVNGAQKERRI